MFENLIIFIMFLSMIHSYSPQKAVDYANSWWNSSNHDCSSKFDDCSPWSYWGDEKCGYESSGGDCANFVSQCLIAGNHPFLNQGYPCRGIPCGKEEVVPSHLANCLSGVHEWFRTCSLYEKDDEPPTNLNIGDVIVFHSGGCDSFISHAALITDVGDNTVKVTTHSPSVQGKDWKDYLNEYPYVEFLHFDNNYTKKEKICSTKKVNLRDGPCGYWKKTSKIGELFETTEDFSECEIKDGTYKFIRIFDKDDNEYWAVEDFFVQCDEEDIQDDNYSDYFNYNVIQDLFGSFFLVLSVLLFFACAIASIIITSFLFFQFSLKEKIQIDAMIEENESYVKV